jgi:hypothetical protein
MEKGGALPRHPMGVRAHTQRAPDRDHSAKVIGMTARTRKSKTVKVVKRNEVKTQVPATSVALTHSVLDRVGTLSKIWSPYTAYIAVLTILGMPSLQFARSESIVWIGGILLIAMVAPLIERVISSPR